MATIEPLNDTQQPISDDQELAKVLAGVDLQAGATADASVSPALPPADDTPVTDPTTQELPEVTVPPVVETPVMPEPTFSTGSDDLSTVKQEALTELRPLVDKLNIPAEEKFDTYLLLLRSTDDKSLIEPAHETAKLIEDESRRAQALLDIIKEIDFLSAAKQ
ncbi:MAG: hypothetical protein QG649_374 [Patescibacteria group bacterium]|jgi:hypothetical protein|nr:hypothetical protein [Patescibacteria group bacterium]